MVKVNLICKLLSWAEGKDDEALCGLLLEPNGDQRCNCAISHHESAQINSANFIFIFIFILLVLISILVWCLFTWFAKEKMQNGLEII